MSQWHLDDLRNALSQKGWALVLEHAGDGYRISGSWEIQRSTKKRKFLIDFEGLDDMKTLPMPQAYGCHLREDMKVQLYFSKQKTWQGRLRAFISLLDKADNGLAG